MGSHPINDLEWTKRALQAYWWLSGCDGEPEWSGLSLHAGFDQAVRDLSAREGLPLPESLDIPECRLEWNGNTLEGVSVGGQHVSRFNAAESAETLPAPGTEARLRHAAGSVRVLVLTSCGDAVLITRAPNRKERREFPRTLARGIAVVCLGKGNQDTEIFDVSEGGVGLSAPFAIEVGETVKVLLRLERKKNLPLECEGVVTSCRRVEAGMSCRVGIRFTRLPARMREEIRRFVRHTQA